MAEESKLIDEVLSNSEETTQNEGFDPTSFLSGADEDATGLAESLTTTTEETNEVEATDNQEDGFSWGDVEDEAPVVEEEVEEEPSKEEVEADDSDDDWDEVEAKDEVKQEVATEVDWEGISKEAGFEATSKEEFIAKIKDLQKPPVQENDIIKNLNSFLEMDDKDLVIADMRAAKFDDEDIADTVDRLQDAGLLKREAGLVRQQLTKHIHGEKDRIRKEEKESEQQKAESAKNSRKELQSFIKDKEEFFGGKVSQKDKKQLYNYIPKGNFAQEVFETHANVAEAAFLWRNKEKIFKMVRTQGVEQGKSRILDGITSPSRKNHSSKSFEAPKKGFDPSKFSN